MSAVFLVGFMGSGKTAVGRILARGLGWSFEDTDALAEHAAGRTVEQIFAQSGEPAFRELEWRALESLAARTRCVVATGGGLFARADARHWMRSRGTTVWLDCPAAEVRRRIGAGAGRPLWIPDDALEWRALYERRRAAYALAELRIDASAPDPEAVARRVLSRLGPGTAAQDSR